MSELPLENLPLPEKKVKSVHEYVNCINNTFGHMYTVVYDQITYDDGTQKTVQNLKGAPSVEIPQIGVDYSQYYLHQTIELSPNSTMNIFKPIVPYTEPEVEDLTDVFNSFQINSMKVPLAQEPVVLPRTLSTQEPIGDEEGSEECQYPLCPICQEDTLEFYQASGPNRDDDPHFECKNCGGYFEEDFDEDEVREIALSRGVKIAPIYISPIPSPPRSSTT